MSHIIRMRRGIAVLVLILALAIGGLIGGLAAARIVSDETVPIFVASAQDRGVQRVSFENGFSPVVSAVADAVVNVSSSRVVRSESPFEPFFDEPLLRRFFGDRGRLRRETSLGSGVIVSPNGYILTNYHVVEGSGDVKVVLHNKREYRARIIGTDEMTDVAVLKVDATGLPVARLGDSNALAVGDFCLALGSPFGLGQSVTAGIISATGREIEIDGQKYFLLQTNAAINPGNSGGGLFDISGNLIGIVNAKSSGAGIEGLGFAIPSNTAIKIAKELIEKGYISGRPKLGFVLFEVNDTQDYIQYWRYSQYITDYGVYIAESESPDFKVGDRIIAIDNVTISSIADIKSLLSDYKVGDTVTITISRVDGSGRRPQKLEIPLTLTEQLPSS